MNIKEASEKFNFNVSESVEGPKYTFVLLQNKDIPEAHYLFIKDGSEEHEIFNCKSEKGTLLYLERFPEVAYISCDGRRFFAIDLNSGELYPLI